MNKRISNVEDIASRHLCTGCGACAGLFPGHIAMRDTRDHGRRPRCLTSEARQGDIARRSVALCPGLDVDYGSAHQRPDSLDTLTPDWGPVLEVWEGYATDSEIRYRGSSGGLASALALFAVEQGDLEGVLHIRARADIPYLNESTVSTTREQILAGAGSRYAPASPCDRLGEIETGDARVMMIGKPCDIAAANRAAAARPRLDRNLGLTLGIFCAGAPSLAGTHDLMESLGVTDPDSVSEVRYRGHGWPGQMTVVTRSSNAAEESRSTSYSQGWGDILQRKRTWRCHVCADHTGELADLSVGDPWYRSARPEDPGQSLLLVRSERGRRFVMAAVAAGYVALERRDPEVLPQSQANLLRTRGAVWGRTATLRLLGQQAPVHRGLSLFGAWRQHLGWRQKAQSFYGTAIRVLRRKLLWPERWREYQPPRRATASAD